MAFVSPLGGRTSTLLLFISEDVVWGSSAEPAGFSSAFVLLSGTDTVPLVGFFSFNLFSTDSSNEAT